MRKIKLFCLPYAGGSAMVYNKWRPFLDPAIELAPVELAGRGSRIGEPFYTDVTEAVADVFGRIKKEMDNGPYALFGHSMGGLIIYLLARRLEEEGIRPPLHIFFSGAAAPQIQRDEKKYHLMEEEEFRREVMELGGTPSEFFEYPDLLQLFLPMLRNDFRLVEKYIPEPAIHPLNMDITVLLGKDDDLTPAQCDGWKMQSRGICRMYHFEGGHFFLHEQMKEITDVINDSLCHIQTLQRS